MRPDLPLYISLVINKKRAKVFKLHEDLVRSDRESYGSAALETVLRSDFV